MRVLYLYIPHTIFNLCGEVVRREIFTLQVCLRADHPVGTRCSSLALRFTTLSWPSGTLKGNKINFVQTTKIVINDIIL